MVAGRKIWERRDTVEATSAVSREKRRTGEATVVRGGNTSPSSTFLTFCGPNACHSDHAGIQQQGTPQQQQRKPKNNQKALNSEIGSLLPESVGLPLSVPALVCGGAVTAPDLSNAI